VTHPPTARDHAFAEATLPRSNGEVVFDHPWQARAMAMAVLVVEHTGSDWDDFRGSLVKAIGDAPERSYWESWVVALESLVAQSGPGLA